ncbi:EF hand [Teladorsagia circumcincta]|uniref:EF hand n=1 Tax=Teladorsagia circumcincta TaxID=45464 RepID=A0A2G9UTU9_TELCI|nr:EF hand [Teladorsagia circumcincta]
MAYAPTPALNLQQIFTSVDKDRQQVEFMEVSFPSVGREIPLVPTPKPLKTRSLIRSDSVDELQRALSNGTWNPFNPETCRLMIGMFDSNGDGAINFNEFQVCSNDVAPFVL